MRLVFLIILLFISSSAFSAQRYSVKDGDEVKIIISKQDVSRLAIEGEGRLKKVWSPDGYLDLKADKAQGEAFFKAIETAPQTFSFFARDDFGNTFTVIATQQKVPSQTIILSPKNKSKLVENNSFLMLPHKKVINSLFKAMFNEEEEKGFAVQEERKIVPLWKETEIVLVKRYISSRYIGEIYEIKNVTKDEIEFHESEFFGFGQHVRATGLEKLKILPNSKTRLFVVRDSREGA